MPLKWNRGRVVWYGDRDPGCDYYNRKIVLGDWVIPRFGALKGLRCQVVLLGRYRASLLAAGDPVLRGEMECRAVVLADVPVKEPRRKPKSR